MIEANERPRDASGRSCVCGRSSNNASSHLSVAALKRFPDIRSFRLPDRTEMATPLFAPDDAPALFNGRAAV